MTASRYHLVEASPAWPAAFERETERLRGLLGGLLVAVHHIGSTSVPGLAAKPIIDLLPVVDEISLLDKQTPLLEQAGYRAWGEYGLAGRRYYTVDSAEGDRTHNLHFYAVGHADVERHLAFRDYLRHDAEQRRVYEAIKREAYARHPQDIGAYCEFKDEWIKKAEQRALEWRRTTLG